MSERYTSYQSIAANLKGKIQGGLFAAGTKLPSENMLSAQFSVSRQTVRRALELLQQEHLLETHHGSGSFVPDGYTAAKNTPIVQIPKVVNVITSFMDSYIFPHQVNGIESVLAEHGCSTHLGVTYNRLAHEERILRAILAAHPDGVIAEPSASALPSVNAKLYQAIADAGIPILFINAGLPSLTIPHVALDNRRGGYLATKHLVDMGHKQIAYIGKVDTMSGHLRFSGYAEALSEAGLSLNEDYIVWFPSGDMSDWLSPQLNDYLMQRIKGCSAVFCYNDQIACSLNEILRQRGLRVPDDVSLVGYDDSEYSQQCLPPCTTIRHPSHELGQLAANCLLEMIQTGKPVETQLLEPKIILRDSVCRPHN